MSRSNGDTSCQVFIQTSQDNPSFHDYIFLHPQRKRFQDVDIKKYVTVELTGVSLEASVDCFQNLVKRFNKCIQVGGDYFEYKYNNFYFILFFLYLHKSGNSIA
jgi:hypothetical protein